jgi:hypothetical protein
VTNFKLDLSNPEEVAARMPELQRLFEEKLREQAKLNEQVELLRRLVSQASAISRGGVRSSGHPEAEPRPPRRRRASPAQDRAVQALEQAAAALGGTAVGPTSLFNFMKQRGMQVPRDASVLGTNLWDAWRAGRIMRAPNGVYTPLDGSGTTEWDRPLTDYYYAAERGFPVPGSWPPADRRESAGR